MMLASAASDGYNTPSASPRPSSGNASPAGCVMNTAAGTLSPVDLRSKRACRLVPFPLGGGRSFFFGDGGDGGGSRCAHVPPAHVGERIWYILPRVRSCASRRRLQSIASRIRGNRKVVVKWLDAELTKPGKGRGAQGAAARRARVRTAAVRRRMCSRR